jgi:protein O-GlcNAc transferase
MNRKQRRAAAKTGDNIAQLWAAGLQHHQAKRLAEAKACFRRVLVARPDYAEGYSNLGVALKDQGKLDEAVAAYRHVEGTSIVEPIAIANSAA